MSVEGEGGRSPDVVSVTAGIPRETKGACSHALNGKPRSISWRTTLGRDGPRPVCLAIRAAVVSSSVPEVVRGVSAPIWRRGRPGLPIASRLMTAVTFRRSGAWARNSAPPRPPKAPPSVERKTSVCAGFRTEYARASSTRAAVPDALSFAPGPVPSLSRCAMTTMVCGVRPGATARRFSRRSRPMRGTMAENRSLRIWRP